MCLTYFLFHMNAPSSTIFSISLSNIDILTNGFVVGMFFHSWVETEWVLIFHNMDKLNLLALFWTWSSIYYKLPLMKGAKTKRDIFNIPTATFLNIEIIKNGSHLEEGSNLLELFI